MKSILTLVQTADRGSGSLYSGWLQLDVLMHAKDVKVHVADIGTIVLLTNPTSFIGII